jgi:hypothetical protein
LLRAADDGIGTAKVLLDLSAVFDNIDHDVAALLAQHLAGSRLTSVAELKLSRSAASRHRRSTFVLEFPKAQFSAGLCSPSISASFLQWQLPMASSSTVFLTTLKPELDYFLLKIPFLNPSPPPLSLFSPNGASIASVSTSKIV